MPDTTATQPWDEQAMRRNLTELLLGLPRKRLDQLTNLPSTPGVYVQFFATPKVEPTLGQLVATGRYPAYIGVAAGKGGLRDRVGRYRQTIRGIGEVSEAEIWVAAWPCSAASALFGERASIDALGPPLQGTGWGSRAPGSNRAEQSPIDALFPGRRWASPTDRMTEARARLRVLSSLVAIDPDGPRWPPLIERDATVIPLAGQRGSAPSKRSPVTRGLPLDTRRATDPNGRRR